MDEYARRRAIGDRWMHGSGIEVGAGASPSSYRDVTRVTVVDKRNRAELEALFNAQIGYEVLPTGEAAARFPGTADFLVAHHVIEHLPDPVGGLVRWMHMLRPEGRVFLSCPGSNHLCEKERLPTPLAHVLDDYAFGRDGDDFDSKLHVPHFINQWAYNSIGHFWYAQQGLEMFLRNSLSEARRSGNDIHWHSFTLDVLRELVNAAFFFSGRGMTLLHAEEAGGILFVVAEGTQDPAVPACVAEYRKRLSAALARCSD